MRAPPHRDRIRSQSPICQAISTQKHERGPILPRGLVYTRVSWIASARGTCAEQTSKLRQLVCAQVSRSEAGECEKSGAQAGVSCPLCRDGARSTLPLHAKHWVDGRQPAAQQASTAPTALVQESGSEDKGAIEKPTALARRVRCAEVVLWARWLSTLSSESTIVSQRAAACSVLAS